jgi:ribonuclease PH
MWKYPDERVPLWTDKDGDGWQSAHFLEEKFATEPRQVRVLKSHWKAPCS